MTTVVSNWYIIRDALHWWTMLRPGEKVTEGATKGRDHTGREGWFTGNSFKIVAHQEYDNNMWRFTGADGKVYIAALSTHYNNPRYPAQCIRSKQDIVAKLAAISA